MEIGPLAVLDGAVDGFDEANPSPLCTLFQNDLSLSAIGRERSLNGIFHNLTANDLKHRLKEGL